MFPGATIDIVQFADDAGGDLIEEKTIRGPLHHQVRQTLNYLDSLGSTVIEKVPGRAEVDRMVTYPHEAIREAVVNAVYHRSYQEVEPTKIYLYPDRMEVTSYPGPVRGLDLHHFTPGESVPAVPARSRSKTSTWRARACNVSSRSRTEARDRNPICAMPPCC